MTRLVSQAGADDYFEIALSRVPLLAILRGQPPAEAVAAAERCWAAGIPLVEVSLSGALALESLEAVCGRGRDSGRAAGAGTVLTPDQVRAAAVAGAAFAVAPALEPAAVAAARELALPYLPGVASPSEVHRALELGCRTLKLFPAAALGIAWLRSLGGPFPEARFVAVGGIGPADAREWVAAGAAIGIGSALDGPDLPELVQAIAEARRVATHA